MKSRTLGRLALLLSTLMIVCGCNKTMTLTKTEFSTLPGPTSTDTLIIPIFGQVDPAAQIITQTQTTTHIITSTQTTISTYTASATRTATTVTVPGVTMLAPTTTTQLPNPQNYVIVKSVTPASPSTLHLNDKVTVTFEYHIDDSGARIEVIPYTGGKATPGSLANSVTRTGGVGTIDIWITVRTGSVKVDHLYIWMTTPNRLTTLSSALIPVDYSYIP